MLRSLSFALGCGLALVSQGQKTPYIPNYLLDPQDPNGAQFTWDKTAESDNFTVIWGNTVGTDPLNASDPDLVFNPQAILDTMETIYTAFDALGFLDDAAGTNTYQYKFPVIMLNTWGPDGEIGWAFGGDPDGVMGTFWAHPLAMQNGHVAAHEFTHSLQAQCVIDTRLPTGLGGAWDNAGIFWETHANFMRSLIYPQDVSAWGMDLHHVEVWGDWKNTYENYPLLMAIMESEGIGMVNRLWREAYAYEYPLQAYKRLSGYEQQEFNDSLYGCVRRMACFDLPYNGLGNWFRQYRAADLNDLLPTVQAVYTIPEPVPGSPLHFTVPVEQAPEEFAYNMIPLHPIPDSCAVIIKFKGHTSANPHAGWRYGFVSANADGTVSRYSPTYSASDGEVVFTLAPGETALYFMVMGAPDTITTNTTNDTWHGYPKHFRFPYELSISGAVPEGSQAPAQFRTQLRTGGSIHANGGGWKQNSANVAPSVYIGPHAYVLGSSQLTGNVRVEGTSVVRDVVMGDQARVEGNAFVTGGSMGDSAVVRGRAFVHNATLEGHALVGMRARVDNYHLHGTIEVGGDVVVYNTAGDCDNGVYYRMTNYYQDNLLECDGRGPSHPANSDVNNTITPFQPAQMIQTCNCGTLPDCLSTNVEQDLPGKPLTLWPNPAGDQIIVQGFTAPGPASIMDASGRICRSLRVAHGPNTIDLNGLNAGVYVLRSQEGQVLRFVKE